MNMKKAIVLIALVATVVACGENKEKQTERVQENMINSYLALKDALVASNSGEAQKAASAFMKLNNRDELTENLGIIADSQDLEEQRKVFEDVSKLMYTFVKAMGTETVLYKQYCPMAFGNKGAYWLASEKEVNNPYFGDRMLHCGSVEEAIGQ